MGGFTGNTRNSHRLLAWTAAEHGLQKQNELAERLFEGYFCKVWGCAYALCLLRCVLSSGKAGAFLYMPQRKHPATHPLPPQPHTNLHQEQFINDKAFLLSSAEAVGLPADQAAAVIDNPTGKGEQLVQAELGKYAGVTGVPHFVVNGRWVGNEGRDTGKDVRAGCVKGGSAICCQAREWVFSGCSHDTSTQYMLFVCCHCLASELLLSHRHHLGGAQPPEAFLELFDQVLSTQQSQQNGAAAPAGSADTGGGCA